jgi:predicted enzyme related to lactoylglutathione lyase
MSERDVYPAGVPCWVETLQADPGAAQRFYAELFGWEIVGGEEYAVARLRGLDVAGIAALPAPDVSQAWFTHVRVAEVDQAAARVTDAGGMVIAAPFEASPAGRVAVVADPAGAQLCLWQAEIREGAQVVNEASAWSMSALQTPDPKAAEAFYAAAFGWVSEPWGPITLFRLPGYVGGEPAQPVPRDVVAVMLATDAAAGWSVDFWVADIELAVRDAVRLGGSVIAAPFERPPFRSAVLADPGGATFSISERVA